MTDETPRTPASYWADQICADLRRRRAEDAEQPQPTPPDPTRENPDDI